MNLFSINEDLMREMMQQAVQEQAEKIAQEKIFWTVQDLQDYTNMHIKTMKEHFFYDPDFPKFKIGATWRFPAAKVKVYLDTWSQEQIMLQRVSYV